MTSSLASFDRARLQLLELLLVVGAHPFEQLEGGDRLLLIDLGKREADMDQNPLPGNGAFTALVQKADVDGAAYPGHIDLREPIGLVDHFNDLTRNCQAHNLSVVAGVSTRWLANETSAGRAIRGAPPNQQLVGISGRRGPCQGPGQSSEPRGGTTQRRRANASACSRSRSATRVTPSAFSRSASSPQALATPATFASGPQLPASPSSSARLRASEIPI